MAEYRGTRSEAWRQFCEAANLAQLHPRMQSRREAIEKLERLRGKEAADKLGSIASLIANRRNSGMRRRIDRFERSEIDSLIAAGVPAGRIAGLLGVHESWLLSELKAGAA